MKHASIRHFLLVLATLPLFLLAAACTPTQSVSITHHSRIDEIATIGATVAIARQGDSLAEADFNKALAQRLVKAGFRVVDESDAPRFTATLKAEVQEGIDHEHVVLFPEYITRRRLVTLRDGRQVQDIERIYIGDREERHRFTTWPATVALTLVENADGRPVFEGDVKTEGSCGAMASLIGPMLDALFRNLRNDSNEVDRAYVEVPTC